MLGVGVLGVGVLGVGVTGRAFVEVDASRGGYDDLAGIAVGLDEPSATA